MIGSSKFLIDFDFYFFKLNNLSYICNLYFYRIPLYNVTVRLMAFFLIFPGILTEKSLKKSG